MQVLVTIGGKGARLLKESVLTEERRSLDVEVGMLEVGLRRRVHSKVGCE